jgi:hypothetical protein
MNLCPYFWSLVSLLALFPFIAFFKIVKLLCLRSLKVIPIKEDISKKIEAFNDKHEVKIKKVQKAAGLMLMWLYFGLIGVGGLLVIIFTVADGKWMELLAFIGGLALLVGLVILIIFGGIKISESDTFTMIKGMIKSKKNKVCPAIEWKE